MMSEIIRIKNYPVENCPLCSSEIDNEAFGGYCPSCKLYALDFVTDEIMIWLEGIQCFIKEDVEIRFLHGEVIYKLTTAEILTKDNFHKLFERAKKLSILK